MNEKDLSQKVYTCVGLVSPFIDITQVYIYIILFLQVGYGYLFEDNAYLEKKHYVASENLHT